MGKLNPPQHVVMMCGGCGWMRVHHVLEDDGWNGIEHMQCTSCGHEWKSRDLTAREEAERAEADARRDRDKSVF